MGRRKRTEEGLDEDDLELIAMKGAPSDGQAPSTLQAARASYKTRLKCRNQRQKELHNAIRDSEITFCQGSAGTGKSYVAAETALELLREGPYRTLILCCPNVESSSMPLGLLPGSVDEKMQPYMDALEFTLEKVLADSGNMAPRAILDDMAKRGMLREEPVSFLRGKTFDNSIIIVDEAENLNAREALLILTRIGRNSKIVMLGDRRQLDRRDIRKEGGTTGLDHAFARLQGLEECAFVTFTEDDIVRNPVISKILSAWDSEPGQA